MTDSTECACPSRRRLLGGAAALGLGAPILAACGSGDSSSGSGSSASGSSGGSGGSGGPGGSGGSGGGADLVATADVPVGSGVILQDQKVVVTQPTKGDFKAFSAVCTHMGCIVANISGGTITCPCHGSQYSVKDGSVLGGPAPAPLPAVKVAVKGNEVVKA
jgi:nitrite reductase/ring-hydroxylating ferredoxin subunit